MLETIANEKVLYKTKPISADSETDIAGFLDDHPQAYNRLIVSDSVGSSYSFRIEQDTSGQTQLALNLVYAKKDDKTYDFSNFFI